MEDLKKSINKTLTFIMAGGHGSRLHPLTEERAKPAVVFGGIYRLLDFTLSNCYHSEFHKIIVLTQYRSRSLHRHILNGWSFFNSRPGEFIDINPPQFRGRDSWYLGTADAIYQNLFTLEDENPEYVLILAGDHIYKMHYGKFLDFHIKNNADITVSCIAVPKDKASDYGVLRVDNNHQVIEFLEKPKDPPSMPGNPDKALSSMGIYIFTTSKLKSVLNVNKDYENRHDFGRDIIPYMLSEKMRVFSFPFEDENRKPEPYWRDVGDIDAYYAANMELVDVDPQFNLYDPYWSIMTWYPPLPPAKTVFADEKEPNIRVGKALDSLLSPGCIISGGIVNRSIISPNVKVNSYSSVEESILLHGVNVGRNAKIRRAILDMNVQVPENYQIGYDLEEDRKNFFVSEGGIVVIPKDTIIR